MYFPKNIVLCEVGPRDGLQNESTLLTCEQKAALIEASVNAGFSVIEIGSFVHPKAVLQMADTDKVFRMIDKKAGVEYRALIVNLRGVDRAIDCGCNKLKLNVSASTAHNIANLNCTPEETVANFQACVEKAKEHDISISGSISMAFGSPWDKSIPIKDVKRIIEAYLRVGVTEISLSDASGMAIPSQVSAMGKELLKEYPEVLWWVHLHNTRGLAMANLLAAMDAGFTHFDTSFGGCGGCPFVPGAAGNLPSEDVVHMLDEMGIQTMVNLKGCMDTARMLEEFLQHKTSGYVMKAGTNKDLFREIPQKQIK